MISVEDLDDLEETIAVLADREALRDLRDAERRRRRRCGARGGGRAQPPCPLKTSPTNSSCVERVVAGPAARAISEHVPEAVATAVIDLVTGPLIENPQRVGKPLRHELEGVWSARRGTFRIPYQGSTRPTTSAPAEPASTAHLSSSAEAGSAGAAFHGARDGQFATLPAAASTSLAAHSTALRASAPATSAAWYCDDRTLGPIGWGWRDPR